MQALCVHNMCLQSNCGKVILADKGGRIILVKCQKIYREKDQRLSGYMISSEENEGQFRSFLFYYRFYSQGENPNYVGGNNVGIEYLNTYLEISFKNRVKHQYQKKIDVAMPMYNFGNIFWKRVPDNYVHIETYIHM